MSWIKLHRDLIDSQCFANPTTLRIWLWLLIKANHKDKFISLKLGKGYTDIKVKRGQMLFGRHKAEEALDIDGSTIYKHIQKLEIWGNIKIQSNNQYSIVTICKYDEYQTDDGEEEQPKKDEKNNSEILKENEDFINEVTGNNLSVTTSEPINFDIDLDSKK